MDNTKFHFRSKQQSRRRLAANGFASKPRTMPPLLNKEKKLASYGAVEPTVKAGKLPPRASAIKQA
jgi:hypothetical protein